MLLFNSVSTVDSPNSLKNAIAIPHASTSPISIDGDDWTTSGVADGSGTISDPYIIANLTIMGDGSAWSKGISIMNSHVYGIIRNVSISNFHYAISIENSDKITIEDSLVNSSDTGIYLSGSNFCNITNNMAYNISWADIETTSSNSSIIENNNFINTHRGIYVRFSTENLIRTNYIFNNTETGINLSNSDSCSVEENIVENNTWGILIKTSENITVKANNIRNNLESGLNIAIYSTDCSVFDNTINDNHNHGINIYYSNLTKILNNSINYNHGYGISFNDDTLSNEAMENTLIKNVMGPIRDGGTNNSIHDNAIIEMLDVSFTASESPIKINIPVNFTDTSIGGLSPLTYSWDFDDGESSNEQNPSHNYTAPGEYTVSLTITDEDGDQSTFTLTLTIIDEEKSNEILGYTPTMLFGVAVLITAAIIVRTKHKFSNKS